jgi:hypothetical protein
LATALVCLAALAARAQEPAPDNAAQEIPAQNENLAQVEARLADRYDRLELLAARLAELSRGAQPRRAALLRDLIAQSRLRNVAGQFDEVVAALELESFSSAIDGQIALQSDLEKLLELLLQEDRDRELASQRKRIARYLQDIKRLIRLERSLKARTDGGDDAGELAGDQRRASDETGKLNDRIKEAEGVGKERSGAHGGKTSGGKSENQKSGDQGSDSPQTPGSESPSPGSQGGNQGQPSQSNGSPGGGGQQSDEQTQSPMERATQRLERARQRMQQAQKQLEESQRRGAAGDQQRAVEQLEQAKAELERILRQLREEELERMLVLLEARLRKMLDMQVEVYDETKRLDGAAESLADHELEIAAGRQSRKEKLIVAEADRALVLLHEDGTSVAFPEAIEQARDDMQSIAERLRETKVDTFTQRLEEDVIEALEETLAMLQQALRQLRDQRGQPQPGGEGQPGEQPLVDQLAELRMIRALQLRVNRRTEDYGAMIEGEQALKAELLEALDRLALRQEKIFRATRDLNTKANQ